MLIEKALTVKTHESYNRAKLLYEEFIQLYFPGISPFPLDVEKLVLFISHCFTKQLAPQTVTTYMSALGHFNKLQGNEDTTQCFVVRRALQGYHQMKGQADVRLPITPIILRKMVQSLPICTSSYYQCSLFKAMYVLALHAFLRIGEITTQESQIAICSLSPCALENLQKINPLILL